MSNVTRSKPKLVWEGVCYAPGPNCSLRGKPQRFLLSRGCADCGEGLQVVRETYEDILEPHKWGEGMRR